jgi:hypothetical protein
MLGFHCKISGSTQQGFMWNYYTLHGVVDPVMCNVDYQYPGDKQLSLDFVNPDPSKIVSQIVGHDDDVAVKMH